MSLLPQIFAQKGDDMFLVSVGDMVFLVNTASKTRREVKTLDSLLAQGYWSEDIDPKRVVDVLDVLHAL